MQKHIRELQRYAKELGLAVEVSQNKRTPHYKFIAKHQNGSTMILHVGNSPSDFRAELNNKAAFRRFSITGQSNEQQR